MITPVAPMLAFPIEDKTKYLVFPAIAQPKLDGFRCIAMIVNGQVALFSRTGKAINTLPLVVQQLGEIFKGQTVTLDGELYSHELKSNFNKIASTIKRMEVHADHAIIQYHIYDCIAPGPYIDRFGANMYRVISANKSQIKIVSSSHVSTMDELNRLHDAYVELGYEGAMYRNPTKEYENKRSSGLLKVKRFSDAEFKVTGAVEGVGKFTGGLGAFICVTETGKVFNVAMNGEMDTLKDYLRDADSFIGRMLTVQFQGKTPEGAPRFPRGLRFREDL